MTAFTLARDDPRYPAGLLPLEPPARLLWCDGDAALLERPAVAIIGTRKPTDYGVRMAHAAGKRLAEAGLVVVSGLARGLDARAHEGALEAGGGTIAVLGGGTDVVYPPGNRDLFEAVRARGLLISEYPPGTDPRGYHFPARNRIIAGLARALLVVEGDYRSGTANTAEWMLRLDRPVLAVPGRLEDPQARGPNLLIHEGAGMYRAPDDVLAAIAAPDQPAKDRAWAAGVLATLQRARREAQAAPLRDARAAGEAARAALTGAEAALYDLLGREPVPVDQLVAQSRLEPGLLLAALSSLEIQGLVTQLPGKRFALAS